MLNLRKKSPEMRPNIIFITCHDLGKHLGCYGQKTVHTPALDRLSADALTFDRSFCTAPQCGPSRAALHTGRYAHSNGMLGQMHQPFNWTFHPDERHAAALLRDHGYETIMVGLQHVSQTPETLGYDRIFPRQPATELGKTASSLLAEYATKSDKPFYMEIGFVEPHRPFDRDGTLPDDSKGVDLPGWVPDTNEARQDFAALQGVIRVMDEGVGMILDALRDHNLIDNTWLIFVTDHGLAMPRAKGTLYDPGIETSLLMRWHEKGFSAGKRENALISHVDILPTMLEAIGAEVPKNLQGISLWDCLTDNSSPPNEHIFAEKTFHTAYEPMRCIRTERHKLILNLDVGALVVPADVQDSPFYPQVMRQVMAKRPYLELYDLQDDPLEMQNLAGQKEMLDIQSDLQATLLHWMEATDDPVLNGAVTSNFQNDAIDALRNRP